MQTSTRTLTQRAAFPRYLAALLLFGSNGLVASGLTLSSGETVLLRAVLGSGLLTAIFLLSGGRAGGKRRRDLLLVALSGAAMAADWLLLFAAYDRVGVSLGMVLNYCGPALVAAFSAAFLGERLTWGKGLALAAAFGGAVCVSAGQPAEADLFGLVLGALSAVAYAAMVLLNRRAKTVAGLENAWVQLLSATAVIALVVLCREGLPCPAAGDWLPVLWLGLVNTGLSCWLYFSAIGALPVGTVAVWGYLEPLSAVVLSVVFLHERLTALQALGGALILGGALLGGRPESPPRQPRRP